MPYGKVHEESAKTLNMVKQIVDEYDRRKGEDVITFEIAKEYIENSFDANNVKISIEKQINDLVEIAGKIMENSKSAKSTQKDCTGKPEQPKEAKKKTETTEVQQIDPRTVQSDQEQIFGVPTQIDFGYIAVAEEMVKIDNSK